MKALAVIDMQNDFVLQKGKLPVPGAPDIVETVRYCIERAREKGIKIIFTRDWHIEGDEEFKTWPEHCIAGTKGAEIVEPLRPLAHGSFTSTMPAEDDIIISKQTISAWPKAEVAMAEVDEVFVAGVATEYCVKAFVDGALDRGKKVTLIVDAIKGVDEIPSVNKTRGSVTVACMEMARRGAGDIFSDDF